MCCSLRFWIARLFPCLSKIKFAGSWNIWILSYFHPWGTIFLLLFMTYFSWTDLISITGTNYIIRCFSLQITVVKENTEWLLHIFLQIISVRFNFAWVFKKHICAGLIDDFILPGVGWVFLSQGGCLSFSPIPVILVSKTQWIQQEKFTTLQPYYHGLWSCQLS